MLQLGFVVGVQERAAYTANPVQIYLVEAELRIDRFARQCTIDALERCNIDYTTHDYMQC